MAPTEEQSKPGGGEGETPSPGVIGGAALVGAGIGALLSGPLVAIGLGGAAAALTLRKDQVCVCVCVLRVRREALACAGGCARGE